MQMSVIALLVCGCALAMAIEQKHYDLDKAPEIFEQFIKDYNRHYKDEADRKVHYDAFVDNLKMINKENKKQTSASFGINKFADYTPEEKKQMLGIVITNP